MQNKFDNSRVVVIVSSKVVFGNFFSHFINTGVIRSEKNGTLCIMENILDALICPGILEINISDFLQIHRYGEVWFESYTEMREIMLYRLIMSRKLRKHYRCCFVNVIGDITLQDASDLCSLISLCEDSRMGFRYENVEEVRMFFLWRA